MLKLFKPVISLWRLNKKVGNMGIAYKLLPADFTPVMDAGVQVKGDQVSFSAYNKTYTKKQVALFGKHGELLLKFIKSKSISFSTPDGTQEVISVKRGGQETRIHASNYDSLKVIDEIFIDQLYDFHSPGQYVVCDAGMNIGAASLYFAGFDHVEKVYGYEPFPDTYALAVSNLALNPGFRNKIEAFPYGLGDKEQSSEVPQPADGFLGGTTSGFFIKELPADLKTKTITVQIKNAGDVIGDIKTKHPGKKIVLKLDCEGAEYEIMEELRKRNLVNDVSVYMIEYHFKGKKPLTDVLLQNGFTVLSPYNEDVIPFGMLYAFK